MKRCIYTLVYVLLTAGMLSADVVEFPGVAGADGANGTRWRSEVVLYNPGNSDSEALLELLKRESGELSSSATLSLTAGETLRIEDLYTWFQAGNGVGNLRVTGPLLTWVRTYNLGDEGTFGQAIPAIHGSTAMPGQMVRFPVVRPEDPASDFRSNLIVLNLEQRELTFHVSLGQQSPTYRVGAGKMTQVNDIGSLADETGVSVMTVTADGSWSGYVSTVDPVLGDPTTVLGIVSSSSNETPPAIVEQPQDATVANGGAATLIVVAEGGPPLRYQWYRGESGDTSAAVQGETMPHFELSEVTTSNEYWVRVENNAGVVASNSASVTVIGSTVATPEFAPAEGTYHDTVNIQLSCAHEGAVIHFTTDGSSPTTASPIYTGEPLVAEHHATANHDPDPFDAYEPLTEHSLEIRAIAVASGLEESSEAQGKWVIDRVETIFDIAYSDPPPEGGGKHLLDIYRPRGIERAPTVVFVHGGAWKQGDKNIYLELGNVLAGYYGLTTIVVNYQLSADPWNVIHPRHVEDVAAAVKWVFDNIEDFGGNPDDLWLFGQSAGAHLVSLLVTDPHYLAIHQLSPDRVRGIVAMSGAYDLFDLVEWPGNPLDLGAADVLAYKTLMLKAFGSYEREVLDNASPSIFANSSQPPFLVIYAWEDMPGFGAEAVDFADRIRSLDGPEVELVMLAESDIPPEVLALDLGGHYEEIYAVNTRNWASRPTALIADFVGGREAY